MIVYKVVEKKTRCCTNWMLFKDYFIHGGINRDEFISGVQFWKKNRGYFPRYLLGTTINAVKESVGIMTFSKYNEAQDFIDQQLPIKKSQIIRVKGLGKPRYQHEIRIAAGCGAHVSRLTYIYNTNTMSPPIGTVTFPAVEVLE